MSPDKIFYGRQHYDVLFTTAKGSINVGNTFSLDEYWLYVNLINLNVKESSVGQNKYSSGWICLPQ